MGMLEKWVNEIQCEIDKLKANSGGGGTYVEANPSGAATDTLEKLAVGNNIYAIPEPENVEANPSGTASATLEKLAIGNNIYSIPPEYTPEYELYVSDPETIQLYAYFAGSTSWAVIPFVVCELENDEPLTDFELVNVIVNGTDAALEETFILGKSWLFVVDSGSARYLSCNVHVYHPSGSAINKEVTMKVIVRKKVSVANRSIVQSIKQAVTNTVKKATTKRKTTTKK